MPKLDTNELITELTELIVTTCNITEQLPADMSPDEPLIGPDSPFGIDSLDAVEIAVAVQRKYNIRIDARKTARQVMATLRTLAEYISEQSE